MSDHGDDYSAAGSETKDETTGTVLDVPAQITAQHKRPSSPQPTIAVDFAIATQMSKLKVLNELKEQSASFNSSDTTLEELKGHIKVIEDEWERFCKIHEKLGQSARRSILTHPYMTEGVYEQTFSVYRAALTLAHKQVARLTAQSHSTHPSSTSSQSTTGTTQPNKLPEIKLPTFSGNYIAWPAFRDLFKSMVINDSSITDVQRMHYLSSHMTDSAAQLIASMPLNEDSFASAWAILTQRFENPRLLVSAHLSRITDNSIIRCNAKDLNHFLGSLTESLNSLKSLNVETAAWDPILVHLISQRLARPLMEVWENKLGTTTTIPTLEQLTTFLLGKARAQEQLERNQQAAGQPTQSQSTHTKTTQVKSNQPSSSTSWACQRSKGISTSHSASIVKPTPAVHYPCDLCGGDHYIVTCSKFLALTPLQRHRGAVTHRLCFNCLGHHNIENCHSSKSCKICSQRHHTMLHLRTEPTLPASSTQAHQ